jgi:hypothetical protein
MQKLKRHGNGGSCFKKHEKLKIKIIAERVMENHIYTVGGHNYFTKMAAIKNQLLKHPISALSLDEGLNSPCDKNASAAL